MGSGWLKVLRRLGLDIFFFFYFCQLMSFGMEAKTILKLVESLAVYNEKSDVVNSLKRSNGLFIEWESLFGLKTIRRCISVLAFGSF